MAQRLEKEAERRITMNKEKMCKPKFKVGDWIINKCGTVRVIKDVDTLGYQTDGGWLTHAEYEKHFWLWQLIEDAKDGDVLACNEEILLFKSYSVQGRISLYCWYNGQTNNFHSKEVNDVSLTTRNKIYPATKEQRDLLFQKMREKGYEWDNVNKNLKKIEDKSAWTEEDEKFFKTALWHISYSITNGENTDCKCDTTEWLKHLKERIKGG